MKRRLVIVTVVCAFAAALAWSAVWLSIPGRPSSTDFVVSAGATAVDVTDQLVAAGFLRNRLLFRLALRQSGLANKLQPGQYDLSDVGSYREIIERLASGGLAADEFTLKLLEGESVRDLVVALRQAGYPQSEAILAWTGQPATDYARAALRPPDWSAEFSFLADKSAIVGLEGYLFPDTYRIFRDAKPEDVVRKLLANFDQRVTPEMRAQAAAAGRTLFDVVTLASVVEREVRGYEDMRRVADLFWRRLDVGMPLQSCATVNYVTGNSRPAVTYEETQIDSPFNTYKYRGLPLGPIGNPGLDALRATLDPLPNDDWYFLTDDAGQMHYARTLDEHNANKAKYLR